MTVWLDTDMAGRATRTWLAHADLLHGVGFEVERLLAELALGEHRAVAQHLTVAATELWLVASVTRRAVDAVRRGDAFDPVAERGRLGAMLGVGVAPPFSSPFGDLADTGRRELRTPFVPVGATPTERGRRLVARALDDTDDSRRIRPDEIGVVRIDGGRYVVILPGVVDLSTPALGWSPQHRSVRDLDRAAIRSSRSTAVADNRYAQGVIDALTTAGVPPGSDLLVVGHSFGADTALDLAADATFNGADGYRVTHVVAAAYHSTPQLPAVPPATEVLVLQNHRDVPVIVEAIGGAHVSDALAASAATVAAVARFDPVDAVRSQTRAVRHQLGAVWAGVTHLVDRADDVADVVTGAATLDGGRLRAGAAGVVTLEPGVRVAAPGQVVSVFAGGGSGAGHEQRHYVDHVDAVDHPAVTDFFTSLDRAGYTGFGDMVAVDVSVPVAR